MKIDRLSLRSLVISGLAVVAGSTAHAAVQGVATELGQPATALSAVAAIVVGLWTADKLDRFIESPADPD